MAKRTTAEGRRAVTLTAGERLGVYAARRFLDGGVEEKLKLRIPFDVYFQDPLVAQENADLAFDECLVGWEPGLGDGPTSARFAVVDYDGHSETLAAPARWDDDTDQFVGPDAASLNRDNTKSQQFHQVNVWAILQRALEFFENGAGLGRRIPWGFDGNRLIVVPHAGVGENAYYDRKSKSLQFYYFDRDGERIHTCLSTDIVHHEFGHAVLDGVRPHYIESVLPQTAAFHEFAGDITAILISLRNTPFRQQLIKETKGDLAKESTVSRLAEQFGKHVKDRPYLRSARNDRRMKDLADEQRPHLLSEVLTGAMFDILIRLSRYYVAERERTVPEAFWNTIQRMQYMAVQPLDLLPPVDVTFADYARAMLRAEEIANPTDPDDYRKMMAEIFVARGILDPAEAAALVERRQVFDRLDLDVFHDMDVIAGSRADAYRFLDDNRRKLFIPRNVDVTIADLSTAQKLTREARRLPRQVILQYIWREDVPLQGPEFGRFEGQTTSLLCGGTLAMNQNGEILQWARKPGAMVSGESKAHRDEQARGVQRRQVFLEALARRIRAGRIGRDIGGEKGLVPSAIPPITTRLVDGGLVFELSPHLGIHDDRDDEMGGRVWQISS